LILPAMHNTVRGAFDALAEKKKKREKAPME
jgi:hypothetical protein